jgi:transposase
VPKLVVPDNTKTGVTKAGRYDPDLNPTYQEMAMHYSIGVVPARPYKPRDNAKVESGVQLAERWIIAALRNRKFFSIEEFGSFATGSTTDHSVSAWAPERRSLGQWTSLRWVRSQRSVST